MSYSPARIDEPLKDIAEPAAASDAAPAVQSPTPSWFAEGFGPTGDTQPAERYRERLARHVEMQRRENEEMEEYRRKLDEKFAIAKRLYEKPVNDNPVEAPTRAAPNFDLELSPTAYDRKPFAGDVDRDADVQVPASRLALGSSAAEPMLRARRPTVPLAELDGRKKRIAKDTKDIRVTKTRRPQKRAQSNLGFYAAAAAVAVVLGAGAGYALANRGNLMTFTADGFAKAQKWASSMTARQPATSTPVIVAAAGGSNTVKPITSARLAVNDVRGQLNSMIPLALTATPASADQPVDLEISGLPQSAYLTAGHQKEDGSWVLKAPEFADVKLVIPESETPKIDLQVAAVEQTSGSLAAPAQRMSVELSDVKITPASAPPDGQPDPLALKPVAATDNTQASAIPAPAAAKPGPGSDLLTKADGLMKQGDVLSARQYYLQAAAAGNPRGTFGVARTYDPKVFTDMKIEGLQPDAGKAAEWYKRAQAAGITASQ